MTKLKLSYFGHVMRRQASWEKILMLEKQKAAGKEGRADLRWIDSIKEAIGMRLQKLSRAVADRTL